VKGVGSIIRETLQTFYIQDKGCGGCKALADEMDAVGPDVVEAKLEHYVKEMGESIKSWRKLTGTPIPVPPALVCRQFILYAVGKSRSS
jgi:hypothetical protein